VSLAGVRVLVTRAAEDAPELETLLRERGAAPLRMPCIAFEDGADLEKIARIVREGAADLVILSSPQAVRRFRALCPGSTLPVATVGAATAREWPGSAVFPAQGTGAEALLESLGDTVARKRVLVARAEGGNPALVAGLRRAGAQVEVCTLYRTVTPPAADPAVLRELREGRVDAIAFASGSAARGFVVLAGAESAASAAVACMGQKCAGDARSAGLRVDAVAEGSLPELCHAVALAVRARKR